MKYIYIIFITIITTANNKRISKISQELPKKKEPPIQLQPWAYMLDVVLNNVSNEVSLSAFIINWKKHFFNKKKLPRKYEDL